MTTHMTKLRSAPPLTIGAALILWGWQTGFLIFALPMLIIIELAHRVSWRWPVTDKEFNILSDLSGVGFFIVVIYIFTTVGSRGIYVILSVIPFIIFLLLVVQLYSERGKIGLSSLFVSLRRADVRTTPEAAADVDLSLPYLLICIISASSGNLRTIWFFILTTCLISIVLWSFRPKRYRFRIWAGFLLLALTTGYAAQEGLRDLQRALESSIAGMFDQFMWRYRDPERATTAIGAIGRLKLSDRIVLRVKTNEQLQQPLLLHEASYHRYNYGVWGNSESRYTLIDPQLDGSWNLGDEQFRQAVTISSYMPREIGVIPLPHGTSDIRDVAALEINKNQYSTVKMEIREGWINYKAEYQDKILADVPEQQDLEITENYRADFERLANELDLYNKPQEEVIDTIENHFTENFTYSLNRSGRYSRKKYLQDFLFNSKTGHCEYFATATVLLLRTVGIPARYAVGFVVDEYSTIERQYIARSRDAHSWVHAFVGGEWRVVDTTPAVWGPFEDENASIFEPFVDLFSWVSYRISVFQARDELEQDETNNNLLYLLIPLILILAWRLFFKERVIRFKNKQALKKDLHIQGMDSSFYSLIDELNKAGFVRRKGETLANWLNRIKDTTTISDLDKALTLHYRYRFDPNASSANIKQQLAVLVKSILSTGLITRTAEK